MRFSLVGLAVVLSASAAAQTRPVPEESPREVVEAQAELARAPVATIRSGALSAMIALPDLKKGFYRGTRFDWSGVIYEVRLDQHRFYGAWFDGIAPNIRDYVDDGSRLVAGPQAAATGPVEEFFGGANNPTPGYIDAASGGSFVKIGVGRLRKPDDKPYSRLRGYEFIDHGKWTIRRKSDEVSFRQVLAPDAGGFGYAYEKTVRLWPGGVIEIVHSLTNSGTKPLVSQVYNHNFMRFDDADTGAGITVSFPYLVSGPAVGAEFASVDSSSLHYIKSLGAGDHVTLTATGFSADPRTSAFNIVGANKTRIDAVADVPVVRMMVWSVRKVVAVEPFIAIDLAPGATKRWTWRYTFSAEKL